MCGINGIFAFGQNSTGELSAMLDDMNRCIAHRGPDSTGKKVIKSHSYAGAIGMVRLSIIDVDSGDQPISSEDNQVSIVFNGEIYNYLVLKDELIKDGYKFNTASDTEVILKLFLKYGTGAFELLDGMYAIAIYDRRDDKLYLARDFFGEKPLYYFLSESQLGFSSELKGFGKDFLKNQSIDMKALEEYLQLTYIAAPRTIYSNVSKLKPGSCIVIDLVKKESNLLSRNQLDNTSIDKEPIKDLEYASKSVFDEVLGSVKSRMISDVPVGALLSGGVDSSIVSFCMAMNSRSRVKTYSVGFEKSSLDESGKALEVAKMINSDHSRVVLTSSDVKKDVKKVLMNFDEPYADSSALASSYIASVVSKDLKVVLTGDGGDEMFGGYNKYRMGRYNNFYTAVVPGFVHSQLRNSIMSIPSRRDNRGRIYKLKRLIDSVSYNENYYRRSITLGFQENELKDLLISQLGSSSLNSYFDNLKISTLSDMRNVDLDLSLEGDLLVKIDRTFMYHSLEGRAPFLNTKILRLVREIDDNLHTNRRLKNVLKSAFEEYFPNEFLDKSKKGFQVPVGDWLRKELREDLLEVTAEKFIGKQKIFNYSFLSKLVNEHINGLRDHTFRLWTIFCFQIWYINRLEE